MLVVLGLYLYSSRKEPPLIKTLDTAGSATDILVKDFHYTQDDPVKGIKWILNAKSGQSSENQEILVFKEFRLKMESKDRPTMSLKGREGHLDRKAEVLELQGNILGESEDQYHFETEQLTYDMKAGQLSTDQPVKIEGPFFTVEGSGFRGDLQKQIFKIEKHSKTVINGRLVL